MASTKHKQQQQQQNQPKHYFRNIANVQNNIRMSGKGVFSLIFIIELSSFTDWLIKFLATLI